MALINALKKATGIGLSPQELLDRAYEKGVLLGPSQFPRAIELFNEAAGKAAQAGDKAVQARARANAALYSFVVTGAEQHLQPLSDALRLLPEIERVGSKTERWPTEPIVIEVEARLRETALRRLSEQDHAARAAAHSNIAQVFQSIFGATLVTYAYHSPDQHRERASARYFLHHGLAHQHDAFATVASNPDRAAESMSTALAAFRQCGDPGLAEVAERWLADARQRRTCWMCHREFQGAATHFQSYPATVMPYVERIVQELGQDASTVSAETGTLVLCTPCSSVVRSVADRVVAERTRELRDRLAAAEHTLRDLQGRVAHLENKE